MSDTHKTVSAAFAFRFNFHALEGFSFIRLIYFKIADVKCVCGDRKGRLILHSKYCFYFFLVILDHEYLHLYGEN